MKKMNGRNAIIVALLLLAIVPQAQKNEPVLVKVFNKERPDLVLLWEEVMARKEQALKIMEPMKQQEKQEVPKLVIEIGKKEKKEEKIEYIYTEEDVKLLGNAMHLEEGGLIAQLGYEQGKRAHLLAGSVIINRRNLGFESSIREVIFAEGQYECASLVEETIAPPETYEWAEELLKYGSICPYNVIFQSEWKQRSFLDEQKGVSIEDAIYEKIGNQFFCIDFSQEEPDLTPFIQKEKSKENKVVIYATPIQ